jgi:putative ABC transport system substrate-binding protein
MRRRDFIVVLGGAAAAWPLATHAQQAERVRRVGLPMAAAADDPECQARIVAFTLRLQQLGWTDSRNVRVDIRWATDPADLRRHAADLAALAPDVIVAATGTTTIAPLLEATRIVPIVFVLAIGPVGAGFVASLSRPGGNATVAQEIAPCVSRVAVLRDPAIASGIGQFGAVRAAAPSLGVELSPVMFTMSAKSNAPSRLSHAPRMVA